MTPFNIQAALDALTAAQSLGGASAKQFAILRDLRERLAGAKNGWQLPSGALAMFKDPESRPVLIIDVGSEPAPEAGKALQP